ncbi:MAG: ABC transporter permease [Nitrososphaerota archaeon]|jgi:ABC-2 type transport system permease protein|nr:ABC transporter permease [Nitrososphaerota archaeon]
MNLFNLYRDELKGFFKSKIMAFLWVGLPVLVIVFHFLQSTSTDPEVPFTLLSALMVSSLGGTLSAIMLSVSIINERSRHVYELFLIRPVKRYEIILAKFLAVYSCVAVAALIAVSFGIVSDWVTTGAVSQVVLSDAGESLAISLSMIAVSCSAGVFIGLVAPSIIVGAILVIYGGNSLSVIPLIPNMLDIANAAVFTIGLSCIVTIMLLAVAVMSFNRKQF